VLSVRGYGRAQGWEANWRIPDGRECSGCYSANNGKARIFRRRVT